jgi:hypothetical protein
MSFNASSLVRSIHKLLRSNEGNVGLFKVLLDPGVVIVRTLLYFTDQFLFVFFWFSPVGLRFGWPVLVVDVMERVLRVAKKLWSREVEKSVGFTRNWKSKKSTEMR